MKVISSQIELIDLSAEKKFGDKYEKKLVSGHIICTGKKFDFDIIKKMIK